jgi:hypothetical protein
VAGDQRARLETLLDTLQQRWGDAVLQSGNTLKPRQSSSLLTGFPALDQALRGGLLDGQTIELLGRPTSGMTTLTYKMLAQAQSLDAYGLYIDLDSTFDPDYAARCGVVLERLLVARPETDLHALTIARDLLASGSVSMIVLDLGYNHPSAESLQRLTSTLNRSGGVILLLQTLTTARLPIGLVGRPSAMRLLVEWNAWLERDDDIRGYQTCVTLLKHRTAAGQQVTIEIDFDDTVAGEPL